MRRTITLLVVLSSAGCLVERGDAEGEPLIPARVQTAFDNNCAIGGCHDATTATNGLSLAKGDSDAIVGGAALDSPLPLVELGNIQGSYLAQKIMGGPDIVGDRMPPPNGEADFQDMSAILAWIGGYSFEDVPECFAEEGCACAGGSCYSGLECIDGVCEGDGCPGGEEGCGCLPSNDCVSDLACINDVCTKPPSETPTFSEYVWPVIEANCSCHNSATGQGGLVMQRDNAYMNLVDQVADGSTDMLVYVDSNGSLSESFLWIKVTGSQQPDEGGRMPPGSDFLGNGELRIISDWIQGGVPLE